MRVLILGLVCLAGCTSQTKIENSLQTNLPKACAVLTTAHLTFQALEVQNAKLVSKEALAWNAAQPICADPSHMDLMTATVAVAQSYAIVSAALKEVKNG